MANNFEKNFDIKKLTSFKIGGKISEVFFPENTDEFIEILNSDKDIFVLGNLSNILISDDGYSGKIILTTKMNSIKFEGNKVYVECGVKGPKLSQEVCKKGLSGLEFMIGFPGSIGGEICMNASANGQCISDKLKSVTCYHPQKGVIKFSKSDMDFNYRTSICQREKLIVLDAEFELDKKEPGEIQNKMDENLEFRKNHQPSLALPNCGSIFKNPEGESAGRLLESIGAKQMKSGDVRVWENHANFIVNNGCGKSVDVLRLMFEMKTKVKEKYNIELEPEIRFLGGNNKEEEELCKKLYKK